MVALGLDIVEAGARNDAGVGVLHAGAVAAVVVGVDDDEGVPVAALAGPSGGVAIFSLLVEALTGAWRLQLSALLHDYFR